MGYYTVKKCYKKITDPVGWAQQSESSAQIRLS